MVEARGERREGLLFFSCLCYCCGIAHHESRDAQEEAYLAGCFRSSERLGMFTFNGLFLEM